MKKQIELAEYLKAAQGAAIKAARRIQGAGAPKRVSLKEDAELLTDADLASQDTLLDGLSCFGLPIQSEEKNSTITDEPRWVIDPLDGTEHFARGSPLYSVVVSLVKNNQPVLGVVCAPALGRAYAAVLGGGAWLNGKKISTSKMAQLDRSILFVHPYRRFAAEGYPGAFLALHRCTRHARYYGSSALELSFVADGTADGIAKAALRLWDVAAGVVIAKEAGAKASAFDGSQWNDKKTSLVVSNRKLHPELLEIIRKNKS